MGLFDSIWIKVKCTKCRQIKLREVQTKELGNNMSNFETGDDVGTNKFRWVNGLCECDKCSKPNTKCSKCGLWQNGEAKHYIRIRVEIDENGKITGKYKQGESHD